MSKQRGNRLQSVQFVRQPLAVAELDEEKGAGGELTGQQRHSRERGLRYAGALLDTALVVGVARIWTQNVWCRVTFDQREDGVGLREIHHAERVGIGDIPRGGHRSDEYRGAYRVVGVTQSHEVDAEVVGQVVQDAFADSDVIG